MVLIVETDDHRPSTRVFLGGWRSRVTGVIYYNACTQTGSGCVSTRDRIVQTIRFVDKSTATRRDASVQVEFFPEIFDRVLRPTTFSPETSSFDEVETVDKKFIESAIKIQRFYRAHRRRATATRPENVPAATADTASQQTLSQLPSYRSRDFVILNRTSPRTRADFELLYNLLDRWRIHETERANRVLFGPSRIALGSLILSKEVELLRAIDAMKTAEKRSRRARTSRNFLDELSKPLLWKNSRGELILVDAPRVLRARELRDTYDLLQRVLPPAERVSLLCRLAEEVEMHTCKRSCDLLYLIDQELDLLDRGVDEGKLQWLRNRVNIAFLRFARDTLRYYFADDPRLLGWDDGGVKKICQNCRKLLPIEKFLREKRLRSSTCKHCLYVKARKGPRVVYEPYERMLRDVRRQEAKARCHGSLAFVVDAKIIYHLVNDIWHGKSAISESDNFDDLRLVRFYMESEWSPWNCLLLTSKEASVHRKIDDLDRFYGPMLLQKFYTKNLQAKVYFESVLETKRQPT